MDKPSNFHLIQDIGELPQVPASTVNIFVEDQLEAEQYAHKNPDRAIYWIAKRAIGVWFTPLRRGNDMPLRALP